MGLNQEDRDIVAVAINIVNWEKERQRPDRGESVGNFVSSDAHYTGRSIILVIVK
jgi:hypothetical protein